jgi:hypothetical protein
MKNVVLVLLVLLACSCQQSNEVVEDAQARISLTVENLPPLENAHYELWATFFPFNKAEGGDNPTHEGEFEFLGDFTVTEAGTVQALNGGTPRFALPRGLNPQLLRDIVVSVELNHSLAKPADSQPVSILIGGAFHGTERTATADLTLAYADAFKTNFSSATGRCTIVAPTSPADSNSGIWFVELGSSASAGLRNLPALPRQWRYEGWVVDTRVPQSFSSTGRFTKADSADSDGAGPASGTGTPFNFPGQDFINVTPRPNFLDQVYSFMVTIEPQPDNSSKPFFLTLLKVNRLTVPPGNPRALTMQNVLASVAPTGRVVVQR